MSAVGRTVAWDSDRLCGTRGRRCKERWVCAEMLRGHQKVPSYTAAVLHCLRRDARYLRHTIAMTRLFPTCWRYPKVHGKGKWKRRCPANSPPQIPCRTNVWKTPETRNAFSSRLVHHSACSSWVKTRILKRDLAGSISDLI